MSESSIDEDRMMQGIDDSYSHIQITWTNCSDKMPSRENGCAIVKSIDSGYTRIYNTIIFIDNFDKCLHKRVNLLWTNYTPEKWEYLNK